MTNIEYIKSNYIEKAELLEITGIKNDQLNYLLEEKLIPNASYVVESELRITSPLEDETTEHQKEEYFGKHVILLIENFKKNRLEPAEYKRKFRENFRKTLLEHNDRNIAYNNIFDDSNQLIEAKFDEIFETEWKDYCAGIYGICTLNATEKEIVEKDIAVKKLIGFNKKFFSTDLNDAQKNELDKLNREFNAVANLFAPYQRESSSRGKYLDQILEKNDLPDKIKKY
ncbi:DUF6058 family natural product biosynthesis protein [Chryseobacterium sp. MIQD13]|uniref:DUF6058 family natural product biosynthesis protein n=1 Tax=Chryseobacterium sp. MIQD13 TaxID=3422310 RepID=UPI003D2E2AFF